jgi:peptide/nickel transport system substrate-binding protein
MPLVINTTRPPFDNTTVRQALNYAVDKETMAKALLSGQAGIAPGVIPPDMVGHNPAVTAYPYDPEKAKTLLKQAGKSNFSFTITASSGRFVKDKEIAQALAGQLQNVGIDAKVDVVENSVWLQRVTSYNNDAYLVLETFADPHTLLTRTLSSKAKTYAWNGFNNSQFENLLDTAGKTFDTAKRTAIYQQIDQLLHDDPPWLVLFNPVDIYGIRNRVQNWTPRSDGLVLTNGTSVTG